MAKYKATAYIRLSYTDDRSSESDSVSNQRKLIENFVERNSDIEVVSYKVDDGYSGTTFDRPAFQRMIADIEAKKVNMVITKDLSRLGRDYIMTGHYMERYFPEKRVRYISLLDGIDTGVESTANDITPFRAIMNDMYAKDISKKRRIVNKMKGNAGVPLSPPPYGYIKNPDDPRFWVVEQEAAEVVRRI